MKKTLSADLEEHRFWRQHLGWNSATPDTSWTAWGRALLQAEPVSLSGKWRYLV